MGGVVVGELKADRQPGRADGGPTSGPGVKCVVWDLDQTMWRGTLLEGDDVQLQPQMLHVVRGLDERGILQSVASRNDHDQAWERLEALGVAEYIVVPQIGWGPKAQAVRRIAEGLGFAYATIAFVDDQPAERAEVAFHLPEVRCYPAEQAPTLLTRPEFTPAVVTSDARRRRQMYQAAVQREAARSSFSESDEAFLRSLHMQLRIRRGSDEDLSRIEELTVRTSQMNATGVHYGDRALRALRADPGHDVLVATLTDRFGPHGAIGVVLLARHQSVWHLKMLATSCRVMSFGVGTQLLRWVVDQAVAAGAHVVADFRPTPRNRAMEITYRFAGFAPATCACLAAMAPSLDESVRRLHLVPRRQPSPTTMQVVGPALAPDAPHPPLRWTAS